MVFRSEVGRAEQQVHVFLVGGQSNADGRADSNDLPANLQNPQEDVPIYYGRSESGSLTIRDQGYTTLRPGLSKSNQTGPEVTFGRAMADFYKSRGRSIALIKYANGDTDLAGQWKAGGDAPTTGDGQIYQNFQATVARGLEELKRAFPSATLKIRGMIWMQGESDCNPQRSGQHEANLSAFITDIRATYGANLPFVIGQLSERQTGTNKNTRGSEADRNAVRTAQSAVAAKVQMAGLVKTDSFGIGRDQLHLDSAGQRELGSAFAAQMQALLAKVPAK